MKKLVTRVYKDELDLENYIRLDLYCAYNQVNTLCSCASYKGGRFEFMETTRVIQKPQKKQKPNQELNVDGSRKCLGNLPDEVLQRILSFLPTKDAVRTSVLSRRWEYLWDSIPNLDFARDPANRNLLVDFVERALCLRDSSVIKRFSLTCDVLGDASRVNTWISTVVRRHNVEELYIHLEKIEGFFPLPYCFFTFLEALKLTSCRWGNLKLMSIFAPKLHTLHIFENDTEESDLGSPNDFCQITIVADRLKKFYYIGNLISEYCLYKSSSLKKAHIDTTSVSISEQTALRTLHLLMELSNVEKLTLCSYTIEDLECSRTPPSFAYVQ